MNLKKITSILLLITFLFSLTACENQSLSLDKIKNDVTNLKQDKVSIAMITDNLESGENPIYKDMIQIYEYDFLETFNIDNSLFVQAIASKKEDKKDPTMYVLIIPKEDKKEEVKSIMNSYFEQLEKQDFSDESINLIKKRKEFEIDDILVYLINKDVNQAKKLVEESKIPIFSMIMNLTDDNLESMIGLNPQLLDEYVVYIPMAMVNTNLYMVLKPKEDNNEEVKKQVEIYLSNLEASFETYLPDQYDIIKNRLVTTYKDYLIYIASVDNDRVLEEIKNCK